MRRAVWFAAAAILALLVLPPLWYLAFPPSPDAYRVQLDANFARPHTRTSFRSEGRDLGYGADLDPAVLERPILVIQGDDDKLVPLFVAEELHARASGSQLLRVENAGHMLPITHPDWLADAIHTFASER